MVASHATGCEGNAVLAEWANTELCSQLLVGAAELRDRLQVPARTHGEVRQLDSFWVLATKSQHELAIQERSVPVGVARLKRLMEELHALAQKTADQSSVETSASRTDGCTELEIFRGTWNPKRAL